MFQFLRRVSTSFLPRPDRPWREDATSNAPTIGRKRRFSITDHDDEEEFGSLSGKKPKTEAMLLDGVEASTKDSKEGQIEGEEVKSVTQGVKQVDLEDTGVQAVEPEAIPLPESPSPQPVNFESTQKTQEPEHNTEVSEVETNVESVQPTEDAPNDTRDPKVDDDSTASSSEKEETQDPDEKVQGASGCSGTVEPHSADVVDAEARDERPPAHSASEEVLEATEEGT